MIKLKGNKSFLDIELSDIISEISNINNYTWKLLWIDGVSLKYNMGKLMQNVNEANGCILTPNELFKISDNAEQLYEVVLIGGKSDEFIHEGTDDFLKEKCEFFIELVDSSYWEITSPNHSFMKKLKIKYL